ncbi:MAG: DUF3313 family protein [Pseudomonadota bacterium]
MHIGIRISFTLCALSLALAACETSPVAATVPVSADVNYDGLATVPSRSLDIAQVRPNVDFGAYTAVMLREPELAFRTPDRAVREFPLTDTQKQRLRDMLSSAFRKELAKLDALALVDAPGPQVLALDIRVHDIAASVSDQAVGRGSRQSAVLQASADATVVLDLKDSESNQILARGVDTRSVDGVAFMPRGDDVVTRFEAGDKVVARWAATARSSLDALTKSN